MGSGINDVEARNSGNQHHNAFGFLRLLFASLVIVSHTPEIVDHNRHRELLTRLVGTLTFGDFAVFGFFVISGYLITGSSLNTSSRVRYLLKRVARIYPAFAVASLLCVFIVGPLAGGHDTRGAIHTISSAISHIIILARPASEGAFGSQNFHDWLWSLNGAMWTIQYEFLCYLLVMFLGKVADRWRAALIGTGAAILLIASISFSGGYAEFPNRVLLFPAAAVTGMKLLGLFLAGSTYYLLKHKTPLSGWRTICATVLFCCALLHPVTAAIGYALFGSYIILYVARRGGATWIGWINRDNDISYGVYLYAWPITQLLIRAGLGDHLIWLGLATWTGSIIIGWLSWTLVEKPAKIWVEQQGVLAARRR